MRSHPASSPPPVARTGGRGVATVFLLLLLALTASGLARYRNAASQVAGGAWLAHTQEVRGQLSAIAATLNQVRLDQRDHALTGGPGHVDAFALHRRSADEQVAALRELVADNPAQSAGARELESLVRAEADDLARSLRRQPGRAADPAADADAARAASLMAPTVGRLAQLDAEEARLLGARASELAAVAARGFGLFVANSALTALVLCVGYGLALRYVGQRNRALASAARLNRDLNRTVVEWRAVFELAPVGIVVADDPLCRAVRGNAAMAAMFGTPAGPDPLPTAPAGDRPAFRCFAGGRELAPEELPLQIAAATGVAVDAVEVDVVRGDGTTLTLRGGAVPLFDERGGPRGAVGVFWDVAEFRRDARRLTEERDAARAVSAANDDYLATVTHDLRTPLAATLLWAGLIKGGGMNRRDRDEALGHIVNSCESQGRLVDDILDLARIAHGKLRVERRPVELAPVVRAACDTARAAAESSGVRLTVDLGGAGGRVDGDPLRLQQVLWNLLSNAVKFTPAGGEVRLRVASDGASHTIEVADTGKGIEAAALPHVFDRFYQADGQRGTRAAGLGLGLSITKHLTELHGGTVRATSDGPGRGTTFTVSLPACAAAGETD